MYGRGAGVSISLQARLPPFLGPGLRLSRPSPLRRSRAPTRDRRPSAPSTRQPPLPRSSPRLYPDPQRPLRVGPAHRASGPRPSVILVPRHGNPCPSVPRDAIKWLTLAQNVSLWKTIRHAPLVNLSNLRASALRHPGPFRVSRGARRAKARRYDDKASLRPLRRPADLLPHRGRIEEGGHESERAKSENTCSNGHAQVRPAARTGPGCARSA